MTCPSLVRILSSPVLWVFFVVFLAPGQTFAGVARSDRETLSGLDTIWVVVSGILVLFMQAGFAFLESGLSRGKNAGHLSAKNLILLSISVLMFWAVGFGISFSQGNGFFGFHGFFVDPLKPSGQSLFPSLAFSNASLSSKVLFESAFCAVSLAIVWGAMAERVRPAVYILFGIVFSGLIYPIVGHWIWGNGWLSSLGMQDFAGSTVVHLQGALSALAGTLLLGPRLGKYSLEGKPYPIPGYNIPFVIIGTTILWLGWFGFNPGSTLGVNLPAPGYFAYVALTTNLAASAGLIMATCASWIVFKAPDMSMMANGALAALVAITASCAFVDPFCSVVIGLVAGLIAVLGVVWIDRMGIDDPVGAVSVHGMAGIWGTLSTGLFASPERVKLLGVGRPGLFYGGGFHQLVIQGVGILAVSIYVLSASWCTFYVLKKTIGLRISPLEEESGLDESEQRVWRHLERPRENDPHPDRTEMGPSRPSPGMEG